MDVYTGSMRPHEAKEVLAGVERGEISASDALAALQLVPVTDLSFAQVDTHRELRQGLPEAIYGASKTAEEITGIAAAMLDQTTAPVIATRVDSAKAVALLEQFPGANYHERARVLIFREESAHDLGDVVVACAGTSDLAVAEEATVVARALGARVEQISDIGVAGVHRTLAVEQRLRDADVVVVVAGMEGALASLVAGITPAPVIAVPTSVGYGAAFEGLAALLSMLTSCAAGVAVMNIDNGFGAAFFAARLLTHRRR